MAREKFASRLGFMMMAAGCAIGLGNVWRFPYITGQFGGAWFVLIYLFFLFILGFPLMVAELALGRASQSDLPGAYKTLRHGKFRWEAIGHVVFLGNIVLMMFYTVVTGWMLAYAWKYLSGAISSMDDFGAGFGSFLQNWQQLLLFDLIGIIITVLVCIRGLRGGVEKALKVMMGGLFLMQLMLIVQAIRFDGAWDGIKFFLAPNAKRLTQAGILPAIHAAMTQAFFTLSLGIGSIAICGSYIGKERSLTTESTVIITLDTVAALASGLIIFPTCFAFGINPDSGPSLLFVTLPKAFSAMPGGRIQGALFFIFMSIAALSTLIAVAENIIAWLVRILHLTRIEGTLLCGAILTLFSMPCLFGFNLWSKFEPFGKGSCVLDLEDFIVSSNLLPLGSVVIVLFCSLKYGWGMENFLKEADTGNGMKFPKWFVPYFKYVLPLVVLGLWSLDIIQKFF